MTTPIIQIYGAARCHKSQYYQQYFRNKNLNFTFLDVEKNAASAEELRQLYPNRKLHFPTLLINGKRLRNPRDKAIEKQLTKQELSISTTKTP